MNVQSILGNGKKAAIVIVVAVLAPLASGLIGYGAGQNRMLNLERQVEELKDGRISKEEFHEFRDRVLEEIRALREDMRRLAEKRK